MVGGVEAVIKEVSEEFNMPQDELLKQGIRTLLERRLREVKSEIFQIMGKYNVSGAEEMESRYREGSLEEADSWRDLQTLDHLEYKRDRLVKLIENF